VRVLDEQVGRQEEFGVARTGADDGAVVADAERHAARGIAEQRFHHLDQSSSRVPERRLFFSSMCQSS